MERGGAGVDCAGRDIERGGGAFVLGSAADVPHSAGDAARLTRAAGLRGAGSLRRLRFVDLRQVAELSAAVAAPATWLVADVAALRGRFAGGEHWVLRPAAGDGCGVWRDRPGDAFAVRLAGAAGAGAVQNHRDDAVVFERNAGGDVRADAVYRSHAGRGGGLVREDLLPSP